MAYRENCSVFYRRVARLLGMLALVHGDGHYARLLTGIGRCAALVLQQIDVPVAQFWRLAQPQKD